MCAEEFCFLPERFYVIYVCTIGSLNLGIGSYTYISINIFEGSSGFYVTVQFAAWHVALPNCFVFIIDKKFGVLHSETEFGNANFLH